jgi:hypothetical protein
MSPFIIKLHYKECIEIDLGITIIIINDDDVCDNEKLYMLVE